MFKLKTQPERPPEGRRNNNLLMGIALMATALLLVFVHGRPGRGDQRLLLAAAMFFLAGFQLARVAVFTVEPKGWTSALLGVILFALFSVLSFSIAFKAHTHLGGGIPFLPAQWNQSLGHVLFAIGGALLGAIAIGVLIKAIRSEMAPVQRRGAGRVNQPGGASQGRSVESPPGGQKIGATVGTVAASFVGAALLSAVIGGLTVYVLRQDQPADPARAVAAVAAPMPVRPSRPSAVMRATPGVTTTAPGAPAAAPEATVTALSNAAEPAGTWSLTSPKKQICNVFSLTPDGAARYRLSPGNVIYAGLYELRGEELVMIKPVSPAYKDMVWRFQDHDHLELLTTSYHGWTLAREK